VFLALIAMILGHHALGLVYLAVAGAAVGFLQFNFPPSRLFMGDGGSTFLGYSFAYLAIAGNRLTPELPVFIPMLILSALYLDAGLTLTGRMLRGEKIFQAHHTHYYQRLLSLGLNHKQVTLLEYLLVVLLGVSAVMYFKASEFFAVFLTAGSSCSRRRYSRYAGSSAAIACSGRSGDCS
jgi:UDP-N-acetylmuramyl pentapeptide phosphotransferase/UDP-N-acetylglucosamine-1-phosphate transferase